MLIIAQGFDRFKVYAKNVLEIIIVHNNSIIAW